MATDSVPTSEIDWGPPGDDEEGDSRRRIVVLPLVLLVATGAVLVLTGGATAHTSFTANDVAITSNGGNVQSLTVAPTGDVHYQGLEQPPSDVYVVVDVKKSSASTWETLDNKTISASGLEGNASFDFATIDLLAQSSMTQSDFRSSDGTTSSTDVDIRVTATLVGAGPSGSDVTAASQATFTVTVENIPAGGNVGGQANTGGN